MNIAQTACFLSFTSAEKATNLQNTDEKVNNTTSNFKNLLPIANVRPTALKKL